MTIYDTRYQARKHTYSGDVVVKVCKGGDEVGYTIMDARDYRTWKRQR